MESQIAQFRPLVEKAAGVHWRRIRGKTWLSQDDLLQAGYIGLLEGLRRYDPSRSYDEKGIEAYLWLTVYNYIQKEITNNNHTLYVGVQFKRFASCMRNNGQRTLAEWARALGVQERTAKEMQDYLAVTYQSMDHVYKEDLGDGITLHELLPSGVDAINDLHEEMDVWERIDRVCCSDLDRAVLRLRAMGYTILEIAAMIGKHERMNIPSPEKKVSAIIHRIRKRMHKEAVKHERTAAKNEQNAKYTRSG